MLMIALCERPRPASDSARNTWGNEIPPKAIPPMVRKSRREIPSQNPWLPPNFRPKTVSIEASPKRGSINSTSNPKNPESIHEYAYVIGSARQLSIGLPECADRNDRNGSPDEQN